MPFDNSLSVNDFTPSEAAGRLGASVRTARRGRRLTQRQIAAGAGVDLATMQELERGRGTVAPLLRVLEVLDHRFADQPPDMELSTWIAAARKAKGWSQQAAAARLGLSKPTIIQVEHGRGQVRSLLLMLNLLGFGGALVSETEPFHSARLIIGDCLEVMPTLPDQSIDAIITDLPYASTALSWDRPIPLATLWEQFRRLLKPTGAVILTASQPFTAELVTSNREWFKYAMVWEKTRPTGFLHAKHMPLKRHEDICVFSPAVVVGRHRSNRQMTYNPQNLVPLSHPKVRANGFTDGTFIGRKTGNSTVQTHTNFPTSVLRFPSEAKPIHPTEKPVSLMRYLVRTFTNEGETVLDCCLGSGTTAVASMLEGRRCIGIEKDETYFEMAKARVVKTASL